MRLCCGKVWLRRAALIWLAGSSLAGCANEDPVAKAEREFEIVSKEGDRYEVCEAARRVESAALEVEDAETYERWSTLADVHCLSAELIGR